MDREALAAAIVQFAGGEIEASWSSLPAQPLDLEALAGELSAEAAPPATTWPPARWWTAPWG